MRPPSDPSLTAPASGATALRREEALDPALAAWMEDRGWRPYAFQIEAWRCWNAGGSGLVHVPTGAGKTYAAYLAALSDVLVRERAGELPSGLSVLYVTPLRAVSRDIEKALKRPVEDLGAAVRVESRTGDTSAALRARQRGGLPHVLVTTPESLSLLLTRPDAATAFRGLGTVVVDEWHELLTSKRGTQVELALARLRRMAPAVRTWALSATVGDPAAAARAACGVDRPATVVSAPIDRPVVVRSVLPDRVDRFPWAGHLGLSMRQPLLEALDPEVPTLIFTNTRSQAERWFSEILRARPEWASVLALHHGSIDRDVREKVEAGLKDGTIRLVVATSSLDLGVDFSPVERVVQIGSPKGIARLIQRAGRSGHRPGAACEVLCVPTHALELIEIVAARRAIDAGRVEERPSLNRPLDVLVQHLVTCSFGEGFEPDALFAEVRSAVAYEHLDREEFDWCLDLVRHGGATLGAYPEQHRVIESDGRLVVAGRRIAQLHRLNVGTITADTTVTIRLVRGRSLGSIEEHFVARLRAGEVFLFAGRLLSFVRLRDGVAFVRPASGTSTYTPRWNGARFPLSTALSASVRDVLDQLRSVDPDGSGPALEAEPELRCAWPVIQAQLELSRLPAANETLVEICRTREGDHLYLFPFEGRLVHEGLAALLALRLGRQRAGTFALSIDDYGVELFSEEPYPFEDLLSSALFSADDLWSDLIEAVNVGQLARRQFREIARVAGLVMQKYPGAEKTSRQLQAGASLLYDVFEEFDPENLLLLQARREVLERQCEESRLGRTLARLRTSTLRVVTPRQPTPLAFPLLVDRLGGTLLSTESLRDRVERMTRSWSDGADVSAEPVTVVTTDAAGAAAGRANARGRGRRRDRPGTTGGSRRRRRP